MNYFVKDTYALWRTKNMVMSDVKCSQTRDRTVATMLKWVSVPLSLRTQIHRWKHTKDCLLKNVSEHSQDFFIRYDCKLPSSHRVCIQPHTRTKPGNLGNNFTMYRRQYDAILRYIVFISATFLWQSFMSELKGHE